MKMTPEEIAQRVPEQTHYSVALAKARDTIAEAGFYDDNQQMGQRWAVACVALEITQRCNLDCSLCYLSENAEFVKDVPLEEVFRRIEQISHFYGRNTDVQITGGDPTLRDEAELIAIVRRVRAAGLRATLMTNGIRARRPLLERLVDAGLNDIAFHVDTTQQIPGYANEVELNALRERYIERTRDLPLSVMFNTSVHAGNIHEIPELVAFFVRQSDRIRTASFQLQADTGRGVLRGRDATVTVEKVLASIEAGARTPINFDACRIGSPDCNRYALCFVVNGNLFDLFHDTRFFGRMQQATAHLAWDRTQPRKSVLEFLRWLTTAPQHILPALQWAGSALRAMGPDLFAARGRVNTLSFLVHNFMDAESLDPCRIDTCSFKVMTADGTMSMCLHNAKRDEYTLPSTHSAEYIVAPRLQRKKFKGRQKAQWAAGQLCAEEA